MLQLCDPDYVHALVDHLEDPQGTAHAIVVEQGTMTLRHYIGMFHHFVHDFVC